MESNVNTDHSKYPVLDHIEVPTGMRTAWQEIVDLISEIYQVPAALIMRVHERDIEVYVRNRHADHPFRTGHKEQLGMGLYCETVMDNRAMLLVPDARKDPEWDHNPDIAHGMISYLGMPLTWPAGEVFGTICVLDTKENSYTDHLIRLMEKFSRLIMSDLHIIWSSLELENANQELHLLNEEMNQFMGIAAHDLRSALNVLLGCSSYLLPKETKELSNKERTYLDLIKKSSSTMLRLMDELLDIARIDTMRLPLTLEETDFSVLIGENIQFNQALAEAKGIQINLVMPPELKRVKVDPGKIEQVLNNLLSNAVKYSPSNTTILVSVDQNPDEIIVSVRDQGPGIPGEEQQDLFNPFRTTSIRPAPDETSTGLGLYIARRIVEEHGGRIWVESDTGKGSAFSFTLKHLRTKTVRRKPARPYARVNNTETTK
jgi:two-component system, sensor histidine kinase